MAEIRRKERLNETVTLLEVYAPLVAAKAQPGQFIILRLDEYGERIPLTIADYNRETGTVTIIFQHVGHTTMCLAELEKGNYIRDFVGPLGKATEISPNAKRVAVIGGGVGCAIAFPQAKALHSKGVQVDVIIGFRSRDIVILEQAFQANCSRFYLTTDDGTYGEKGLVTEKLKRLIDDGAEYDLVIAIGPIPMMKYVSAVTKPYGIHTMVSLNPIMIDGTGMCGGCRVTVDGKTRFACVDGPDFDGHSVDFDELINRNSVYQEEEQDSKKHYVCRIEALGKKATEQGEDCRA